MTGDRHESRADAQGSPSRLLPEYLGSETSHSTGHSPVPQSVCSSIYQRYLVLLQSRTVSSLLGASFTFPPPTAEGSSRHCKMFRGCQITSFGGWCFNPQAQPGVLAEPHTTSCSLLHACVCELSACCFGRRVFLLQSFLDLWKPSPDKNPPSKAVLVTMS